MTPREHQIMANHLMLKVKDIILKAKKELKKPNIHVDIYVDLEFYKGERKAVIKVNYQEHIKYIDLIDLDPIMRLFAELLFKQREVKGWGNLLWIHNGWVNDCQYISDIYLLAEPCKEYKALKTYLEKYATTPNYQSIHIEPWEFWHVSMGGKRGRLYGEEGLRHYLEHDINQCRNALEVLRKYKSTRDKVMCERGSLDYIDPEEKRYSEYHEVECDGERRKYLKIFIATPSGKMKCALTLY